MLETFLITEGRIKPKTAFIQIKGVNDPDMVFILEEDENVLSLEFDDADEPLEPHTLDGFTYVGVYPMTEDQAEKIVDFVIKNLELRIDLIVHCRAGQSRSAGVAKFVSEIQGEKDYAFYLRNPNAKPNRRIISMLHKKYQERKNFLHG